MLLQGADGGGWDTGAAKGTLGWEGLESKWFLEGSEPGGI